MIFHSIDMNHDSPTTSEMRQWIGQNRQFTEKISDNNKVLSWTWESFPKESPSRQALNSGPVRLWLMAFSHSVIQPFSLLWSFSDGAMVRSWLTHNRLFDLSQNFFYFIWMMALLLTATTDSSRPLHKRKILKHQRQFFSGPYTHGNNFSRFRLQLTGTLGSGSEMLLYCSDLHQSIPTFSSINIHISARQPAITLRHTK